MKILEIGVPLREGKKVTHSLFTKKEKYMYFKGEYLYFAYGRFGYIGDFLIYDKRRKEFNTDNNWSIYNPKERKKKKFCPNCKEEWNGTECNHCGFDIDCFDPNWDLD